MDKNGNGVKELAKLELSIPKIQVALYKTADDAKNDQNAVAKTTTNAVGMYSFTKLAKGTYFMRYGFETNLKPVVQSSSLANADGTKTAGIVQVNVNQLMGFQDLAAKRTANLTVTPFEDLNINGVKDANESIMNGKTVIFINLEKTADLIQSGRLNDFNLNSQITSALSGSLDIEDAILFRTSAKGAAIQLPNVDSGMYIMMRSPFNLTLGDLLGNLSKINALVSILTTGDVEKLLDDPSLIATGDAATAPDNEYLKSVAKYVPEAIRAVSALNIDKYLEADVQTSLNMTKQIMNVVSALPATRVIKVDLNGDTYDLTGFKFTKTTNFDFGIRKLPQLTGKIFTDANQNGVFDTSEKAYSTGLTVYDRDGRVLKTITTSKILTSYTMDKLPFDTQMYVGINDANAVFGGKKYSGYIPASLKDKNIIAAPYFSSKDSLQNLTLDIPILP